MAQGKSKEELKQDKIDKEEELKKLAEEKKAEEKEAKEKAKAEADAEKEAKKNASKEVRVLLEDGTIRVYSEKENGKDYAKLAESLVSKKPDKREIVK